MGLRSKPTSAGTSPTARSASPRWQHGITPRYLHMLFEDDAMTFSQYVLDQRLALACRRLRDPRLAGRTISSIAHDVGFGDLSYFNRTFRRRYGVTPSGARVSRLPRRDVEDHVQERHGRAGDLRSLWIGVDCPGPFGLNCRDAAGELEHHPA